MFAEPLHWPHPDHLCGLFIVANLVNEVKRYSQDVEWALRCPRKHVHVVIARDVAIPLCLQPTIREIDRLFGPAKTRNVGVGFHIFAQQGIGSAGETSDLVSAAKREESGRI